MPIALVDDGVRIAYNDAGQGFPLILCHEASGDKDSWMPQIHFFSRRNRVITINARGYPPSDVPENEDAYSQERCAEDICAIMKELGLGQAYVGGQSIGAATALNFALIHPEMTRGLILAGAGATSMDPDAAERGFRSRADQIEKNPDALYELYGNSAGRHHLKRKDPVAWQAFEDALKGHSAQGSMLTIRGVLARRPAVFELEEQLRNLQVPTLILLGDEDVNCIDSSIRLKRLLPKSGLAVFPQSGHSLNLEEPALFNQHILDFMSAVEEGKWADKAPPPKF